MVTYLQSTVVEFDNNINIDLLITGGIYWSVFECGVGLISCCLPIAYGVFRTKANASALQAAHLPARESRAFAASWESARGAPKGRFDRLLNDDSHATDIELMGRFPEQTHSRTTTRAEGLTRAQEWDASPKDQIFITKTFGAEKQSPLPETA